MLLAVLPFSQRTFAVALPSQRAVDFAAGVVAALRFFGGTPRALVLENLKAFVTESHRYERSATIIVSQLPVAKWHEYLNEPTVADAILDRLVPRAHRVELTGKSRRTMTDTVS